jgi:hypothetical protein
VDGRSFALAFADRISRSVDNYFGARLLSKRTLTKSFKISTSVLLLCLGLTGVQNGRPIGVAPWTTYRQTAAQLQKIWSRDQPPPKTEAEKKQQKAMQDLEKAVMQYNSTGWLIFYSITSHLVLALLNATLFFFSVVFSRLILREIIAAGRVFSTISLLLANFALVLPAWTVVFLLVTVLFTPALWLMIPLVFVLSRASVYWLVAMAAGG